MNGVGAHGQVGVIAHLENPSVADVRALAVAAEETGADWLGVADAFWWRDVWIMLAEAARVTERLVIGPVVTNPYLRHPFHTVSAVATLQEVAGDRVLLGLAAGGSEVSGAAGIARDDAGSRIAGVAALVRSVAAGGPLDPASGRRLDVPLLPVPILVAGRGNGVLRAAGRCADRALLWAVPDSDVERSAGAVRSGAAAGRADGAAPGGPDLVWAPLVVFGPADRERARVIGAYGILNVPAALRARWGVGDALVAEIRARLVAGGAVAAAGLVPDHVVDDVALPDPSPSVVGARAAAIGAGSIAFPAYETALVGERVAWARAVLAAR